MPNVYPIEDHYLNSSSISSNKADIEGISSTGSRNVVAAQSLPAERIIQSYNLRMVSQDQINKWDSVFKSIEQNNGINYRWHQSIKVTQKILDRSNLITLPNNRSFYDYDSKSTLVFVNNDYIAPNKYRIVNSNQFYFMNGIIKLDDYVHIIHMNKENTFNNYDTSHKAIATIWQYTTTNNGGLPLTTIALDDDYAFINADKYSVLVYINNVFVNSVNYEILNTREIEFSNGITLNPNDELHIIQLGRVFPNEEYVGYLWGESIKVVNPSNVFKLSNDHAFSSKQDRSALIFVNNEITRAYKILNTNTIQFEEELDADTNIEIIQLGYISDISKLIENIDFEKFEKLLRLDIDDLVKEDSRNQPLGFAGVDKDGFIDLNLINFDLLVEVVKHKLVEQGWSPTPSDTPVTPSLDTHSHPNYEVLSKLQLHNNKLYIDGYPVGEKAIEVSYNFTVTNNEISGYGFDLPNDCDVDRPITLVIENVTMINGDDYIITENEMPISDRISWYHKNMEYRVEVGDKISVTYYKKVSRILPPSGIENNTTNNHKHNNLDLLNSLSTNSQHQLLMNGIPVGEEAIEVTFDVTINRSHLLNKAVELPHDCSDARSIRVILANVPQIENVDYRVEFNNLPENDKIVWNELGMENTVLTGDKLSITYYKKVV